MISGIDRQGQKDFGRHTGLSSGAGGISDRPVAPSRSAAGGTGSVSAAPDVHAGIRRNSVTSSRGPPATAGGSASSVGTSGGSPPRRRSTSGCRRGRGRRRAFDTPGYRSGGHRPLRRRPRTARGRSRPAPRRPGGRSGCRHVGFELGGGTLPIQGGARGGRTRYWITSGGRTTRALAGPGVTSPAAARRSAPGGGRRRPRRSRAVPAAPSSRGCNPRAASTPPTAAPAAVPPAGTAGRP